jgi:hypothetical protein
MSQAGLLLTNSVAILNNERFLDKREELEDAVNRLHIDWY